MQQEAIQIIAVLLTAAFPIAWVWWAWRRMQQSHVKRSELNEEDVSPSDDFFPLRDDWPAQPIDPRKPGPDELAVDVYQSQNSMEAGLLQQQLEFRGIKCEIEQRESGGYNSASFLYVRIWSGDEAAARELICRLLRATPATDDGEGVKVLQYEPLRVSKAR